MFRFLKYIYSFFSEIIIEKTKSDINPSLEVSYVNGKVVLNTKNANYSYGSLHRVFQKVFKEINISNQNIKNALILGFGAGSVAYILLDEYNIDCKITGVELDPTIIEIAKNHFSVSRHPNVRIINQNAVDFILNNKNKFDLVVVDVYIDNDVPEDCESVEFIENLGLALNKNGIIVFNKLVYNKEIEKSAKELQSKFENILGKTDIYRINDNWINWMIIYYEEIVR